MATFKYKNGKVQDVKIGESSAEVFISVETTPEDEAIEIGGHTIINLDGSVSNNTVQVNRKSFGSANAIVGKKLSAIVNASKFKVVKKEIEDVDMKATCVVKIFTDAEDLAEFTLDDSANPKANSRFIYVVSFSK